jgi:hypothetical protein
MLAQFRWEGQQPLTAGKHTVVFDFTYDGPGIAKGGSGVLTVDGQDVATLKILRTRDVLDRLEGHTAQLYSLVDAGRRLWRNASRVSPIVSRIIHGGVN